VNEPFWLVVVLVTVKLALLPAVVDNCILRDVKGIRVVIFAGER